MSIVIAPGFEKELKNYENWLNKRNLNYRVLTKNDYINKDELLLLCGGADIGKNKKRDLQEIKWITQSLILKNPILGICRGMQLINVLLQGSLFIDLPEGIHYSKINEISTKNKKDSKFHKITFYNDVKIEVNSRHHQAIKKLGIGLKSIAKSEDGIIEAVKHINYEMLLVQWHPELEEVFNKDAEMNVSSWIDKVI